MGMSRELQLQKERIKEIEKLDAKINKLRELKAKWIKKVVKNITPIEKEFGPKYVKRLKKILKDSEQGKITRYKSFEEFAKHYS